MTCVSGSYYSMLVRFREREPEPFTINKRKTPRCKGVGFGNRGRISARVAGQAEFRSDQVELPDAVTEPLPGMPSLVVFESDEKSSGAAVNVKLRENGVPFTVPLIDTE
jgi:hypothetical protein